MKKDNYKKFWAEDANSNYERLQLRNNTNLKGGGFDREKGYTRRVVDTKPWIDFNKPLSDSDIPDYKTFVAGLVGVKKEKYQAPEPIVYPKSDYNSTMIVYFLIFITIFFISFLIYHKIFDE